jgi:hypothetical protein
MTEAALAKIPDATDTEDKSKRRTVDSISLSLWLRFGCPALFCGQKRHKEQSLGAGVVNIGSTCFLGAIVSTLMRLGSFVQDLVGVENLATGAATALPIWQALFQMTNKGTEAINPRSLKVAVAKIEP